MPARLITGSGRPGPAAASGAGHGWAGGEGCFPGLGIQLGARVLAEIGDDRQRFPDARGLKAYAGASPIRREQGRSRDAAPDTQNSRGCSAGRWWTSTRNVCFVN
ncbi:transposase [Streptomyces sp. NPDC058470]|uniref:transposase n=1 Tax=Streptomyces sp. NPDC058470 TaxID=3346515 RepID=UPI003661E0CA